MSDADSLVLPIIAFEGAIAFAVRTPSIYSEARLVQPFHLNCFCIPFCGGSFFLPK